MGYVEELLGKNEQIVIRTRRHWMVLARSFLANLVLTIAIVIVTGFLAAATAGLGILALILLLLPGALFLRDYLAWSNEEYIVTNQRVVQTEGIINKHVIDSSLEKVNDVVLFQSFLGRIFDYGNIEIMTASESGVNKLQQISQPIVFKTEMLNQKEALSRPAPTPPLSLNSPEAIPLLIAQLDDLRKRGILSESEFQEKKAELLAKM